MAFTVTGRHAGATYRVTWNRGELSGDPEAVALVQRRAAELEGRLVAATPTGPFTETDHVSTAHSVLLAMDAVFPEIVSTRGHVHSAPQVKVNVLAATRVSWTSPIQV